MPTQEVAFVFDGTLEGLLSAVFAAYAQHIVPSDILTATNFQPRLGQLVQEVETDMDAALRVQAGICRRCGPDVFEAIKCASLSDDPAAGTVIYRFIRYAIQKNRPQNCSNCPKKGRCGGLCTRTQKHSPLYDIAHPAVEPFIRVNRAVANERQKVLQFLRFEHMEGGLWFAQCNPKASVVPLLMDWFVGRFNTQAFLIFDEVHGIAGVYEGKDWYLVKTYHVTVPEKMQDEQLMQQAWKRFYRTIAIESRYNPELRMHFMPKRLWKNIIEMQEDVQTPVPSKAGMKLSSAAAPSCQK
ncbi:MAG: TIGR03915 family putative DNA repair protein [Eggerthellaceae bacterium]|nr:TIGR03915 family putative DNA repair protein [Eggerthellaceae bacterium]